MLFYLDTYDGPYAFFSRGPGGAETYDVFSIYGTVNGVAVNSCPLTLTDTTAPNPVTYSFKANGNGAVPVAPFRASASQFVNPKWCQIISAGPNNEFGPGGTAWNPATGYGNANPSGNDDLSNFSTSPLGTGAN
jgi:hypothetical protein